LEPPVTINKLSTPINPALIQQNTQRLCEPDVKVKAQQLGDLGGPVGDQFKTDAKAPVALGKCLPEVVAPAHAQPAMPLRQMLASMKTLFNKPLTLLPANQDFALGLRGKSTEELQSMAADLRTKSGSHGWVSTPPPGQDPAVTELAREQLGAVYREIEHRSGDATWGGGGFRAEAHRMDRPTLEARITEETAKLGAAQLKIDTAGGWGAMGDRAHGETDKKTAEYNLGVLKNELAYLDGAPAVSTGLSGPVPPPVVAPPPPVAPKGVTLLPPSQDFALGLRSKSTDELKSLQAELGTKTGHGWMNAGPAGQDPALTQLANEQFAAVSRELEHRGFDEGIWNKGPGFPKELHHMDRAGIEARITAETGRLGEAQLKIDSAGGWGAMGDRAKGTADKQDAEYKLGLLKQELVYLDNAPMVSGGVAPSAPAEAPPATATATPTATAAAPAPASPLLESWSRMTQPMKDALRNALQRSQANQLATTWTSLPQSMKDAIRNALHQAPTTAAPANTLLENYRKLTPSMKEAILNAVRTPEGTEVASVWRTIPQSLKDLVLQSMNQNA
jgi:hypothetical protein